MNGNVIVGQSGGPTSVINSSLVGVFQGAKRAGCGKIYGMRNGLEGLLQERYVELNDCIKNDLDIEILKRTPSSFLGTCRYKLPHYEKDSADCPDGNFIFCRFFISASYAPSGYYDRCGCVSVQKIGCGI